MRRREVDLETLGALWRDRPRPVPSWDAEEVLMQVRSESDRFDRKIRRRDLRETLAGVFVVLVMGIQSLLAPGIAPKLGAVVAALCVGYVIWRLVRARRSVPPAAPDVPLVERLRTELARVDAQIDLLRGVARWYMLPIAIGSTVWMATLVPATGLPLRMLPAALAIAVGASIAIFAGIGVLVVRMNRHALRSDLLPYRRQLEELLEQSP